MKARPSFSFYPVNATDPECEEHVLRVDFVCENGMQFGAFMPVKATLEGYMELGEMEEAFVGIGKIATGLAKMFERQKEEYEAKQFSGLDAPLPPEHLAKKYN
jgi:hypothetical protein